MYLPPPPPPPPPNEVITLVSLAACIIESLDWWLAGWLAIYVVLFIWPWRRWKNGNNSVYIYSHTQLVIAAAAASFFLIDS